MAGSSSTTKTISFGASAPSFSIDNNLSAFSMRFSFFSHSLSLHFMMAVTFHAYRANRRFAIGLWSYGNRMLGKFLGRELGSVTPRGNKPESFGDSHEVSQRFGFHFVHDLGAMNLYRFFTRTQFRRDLFIQGHPLVTSGNIPVRAESGIITALQLASLCTLHQLTSMLFDPALNGFEQILFFHGLSQELKRSGLHCANRHWNIFHGQ